VDKKFVCENEGGLEAAATIEELDIKVTAMPDEVEVFVQRSSDGGLYFLWGQTEGYMQ